MGRITNFFTRGRDAPNRETTGAYWVPFFGRTLAGKTVTERTSMQTTAVYACVRVLSESIASLPLMLYRYGEDKNTGKSKVLDHPLYRILHDEPNPEMTSFSFRETQMTHLLLWGNAYSQIHRNQKGDVIGLYPLMPNRMRVMRREKSKKLVYVYSMDPNEGFSNPDSIIELEPHDVLHVPGLGFDGLVGYSPIAMAKNAVGLAIAAEEYGSKFFNNGAAPSGVLEHPGTVSDPAKLRESWHAAYGGSANAGKVAVLEEGMHYTPVQMSPSDAQFLETRKFQTNEIARIFRVPLHMLGDLEKATYANIEQQSIEFVKYTLTPWVVRWEQSIQRSLLTEEEKKTYFVKFNVEGMLRGDYESRMNGYAIARQNGWMSTNDIRELEDMDRIDAELGGDLYLVNGNMLPLNRAGEAYNDNAMKGGEEDE